MKYVCLFVYVFGYLRMYIMYVCVLNTVLYPFPDYLK